VKRAGIRWGGKIEGTYLDGAVKDAGVSGRARVGDEGVDLAEVLDHVLDELLRGLVLVDLELVCLGLYIHSLPSASLHLIRC